MSSARKWAAALRRRWPLRIVEVSGPSMVPTLHDGDVVLVRHIGTRGRVPVGRVVLARYRSLPDRLVVKRTVRAEGDGWWLASDNPAAGGDSERHGVADVEARVLLRLHGAGPARLG